MSTVKMSRKTALGYLYNKREICILGSLYRKFIYSYTRGDRSKVHRIEYSCQLTTDLFKAS